MTRRSALGLATCQVLVLSACVGSFVEDEPVEGPEGKADGWQGSGGCEGWLAPAEALRQLEANLELVVDKRHALPSNFAPTDLASLSSVLPGQAGSLRSEAAGRLAEAFAAARSEAGITNLSVLSSYRSFQTQCSTFASWVATERARGHSYEQAVAIASTYSARPGHSEHQLGLAVDLTTTDLGSSVFSTDFIATRREGRWLADNLWRFGFVLSYPRGFEACTGYTYEAWHYRYVGREAARSWHDEYGELAAYEFLRGERCGGGEVPGRPPGGPGAQLPLVGGEPEAPPAPPEAADVEAACAGLAVPGVDTCRGSYLLNCRAGRWDYCQLGCQAAGYGEDDSCASPADRQPSLEPAALCASYASAAMPSGVNTCSSAYAGWLLVCEARPAEGDSPPEWRYCQAGCRSAPIGSHDDCR